MKLLVACVATRPPAWVVEGWNDYAKRMPRESALELIEVKPESRSTGKTVAVMMASEAQRINAALPNQCLRVVLDEHGDATTTRQLADRLKKWMSGGQDVAFIIGGPDGLDASIKQSANETLRLSSLTLPHALVRVILAEALYRAASLLKGHPYHRE
ncbi:MAG: 23S rRNA (pseudouridine(1915)-N(3))-methyltransferase RlmH [Rhodocyclaceae bacterium]|nr:23S rRNA (pseudouridine(1915)-N(3))-methyltransferase RlmH [Rhodocyclaceae bacterium]